MMHTTGDIGTKNVIINSSGGELSDVQVGIEFIYNMREHIVDIGIATVYLLVCYKLYLWLKKDV